MFGECCYFLVEGLVDLVHLYKLGFVNFFKSFWRRGCGVSWLVYRSGKIQKTNKKRRQVTERALKMLEFEHLADGDETDDDLWY